MKTLPVICRCPIFQNGFPNAMKQWLPGLQVVFYASANKLVKDRHAPETPIILYKAEMGSKKILHELVHLKKRFSKVKIIGLVMMESDPNKELIQPYFYKLIGPKFQPEAIVASLILELALSDLHTHTSEQKGIGLLKQNEKVALLFTLMKKSAKDIAAALGVSLKSVLRYQENIRIAFDLPEDASLMELQMEINIVLKPLRDYMNQLNPGASTQHHDSLLALV